MKKMEIETVVNLFNEDKKSLREIGLEFNVSKSTVQRFIIANGYVYNSNSKLYILKNLSNEIIQNKNSKNLKDEKIDNLKTEKMVNGSYTIPSSLARSLKLKAVLEDKNIISIVREAIETVVEDKYKNM